MKEFQFIIDEVHEYLFEDSHNEARNIERLKRIQKKRGLKLYQALLYILTHLEFSE